MSGVAGSAGKHWTCRYSFVAASMSRCSVSRACGRQGTAHSVVNAVALEIDVWIRL